MERVARDPIYKGRRFSAETIETCVRWYITYRLSYRDLVAMMAEQGIVVSHTTIMRWVLRYVPEYERRWSRYARSPGSSWRMDETAVEVRGGRHYLYRAVERHGKSVASLLCSDRTMEAAQALFSAWQSARTACHGRRRSTSTATAPRTVDCVCWRSNIIAGRTWRSGRAAISTTWWSRTIAPSSSGALRCWASRVFARPRSR